MLATLLQVEAVELTRDMHPLPISSFPPEFILGRDHLFSAEQTAAGVHIFDRTTSEHVLTSASVPVRALQCLLNAPDVLAGHSS